MNIANLLSGSYFRLEVNGTKMNATLEIPVLDSLKMSEEKQTERLSARLPLDLWEQIKFVQHWATLDRQETVIRLLRFALKNKGGDMVISNAKKEREDRDC